jgi:hypothetical protein
MSICSCNYKKIICAEMVDAPGKNDETEENIRLQIVYFEVKSKRHVLNTKCSKMIVVSDRKKLFATFPR